MKGLRELFARKPFLPLDKHFRHKHQSDVWLLFLDRRFSFICNIFCNWLETYLNAVTYLRPLRRSVPSAAKAKRPARRRPKTQGPADPKDAAAGPPRNRGNRDPWRSLRSRELVRMLLLFLGLIFRPCISTILSRHEFVPNRLTNR